MICFMVSLRPPADTPARFGKPLRRRVLPTGGTSGTGEGLQGRQGDLRDKVRSAAFGMVDRL